MFALGGRIYVLFSMISSFSKNMLYSEGVSTACDDSGGHFSALIIDEFCMSNSEKVDSGLMFSKGIEGECPG